MNGCKIRVVFLCNAAPAISGTEKTALMLHDGIDRSHFDVRFVMNGYGPFYEALQERGADVEVIESEHRYSYNWHNRIIQSLSARPADIVQLHASRINAFFLRKHTNAFFVERLNMYRHNSFIYPMRWKWLDRRMSRYIDHFIVVSESLKDHFLNRGYPADKMDVIYNGVDFPEDTETTDLREELDLPSRTHLIGTVGRLVRQKGIDVFIYTAKRVLQSRPDVHFIIAGEGEMHDRLAAKCKKLGIQEKIHFLGYRSDIKPILMNLDVLLYLSRWEPFANTILEGMAAGTAIIATDVGGNKEALESGVTGRLVPSEDPVSAAAVSLELLNNHVVRKRLGEHAEKVAAEWSVNNMVKGHENVYRKITDKYSQRKGL